MVETKDYKNTIQLPQTPFPMKGNLSQKEPEIISKWNQLNIHSLILNKNSGKKIFTLPDGPPYANGSIHMGHALNKTLKDVIIKFKNMTGYRAAFIPGWDCHGLPIEHKVMKDLAEKKLVKTDHEILQLCRAEAQSWIDHQKKQFQRLGVIADWDKPYLTMSAGYEAEEIREFARAFEKGLIYQGKKPVYWNWTLKTALADAEVEYHMHKSPSIYVQFPVRDPDSLKKLGHSESVSFLIWTTTPWTLPANVGICLHPDLEYGLFQKNDSDEKVIFAKVLQTHIEAETGFKFKFLNSFLGKELDLCQAEHPWLNRKSTVILGLHVTHDTGTGCVHTAPGHGADDYKVGFLQYHLPLLCPVDEAGCFTNEVPEFKGVNIFKANPLIVQKLKELNMLLGFKEIEHSYPHCWRSKTPLIFRTTPQWFLGIDLEGNPVRKKTLEKMKEVEFFPEWGRARFQAMMENRPDWCLSRQRIWGVPIPVLFCNKTGEVLADKAIMFKIADCVEKGGGLEAFYKTPVETLISGSNEKIKEHQKRTPGFGEEGFRHGRDILDVWFDSGVCHAAVQKRHPDLSFPADIYLEGSDQHRGWFNTSMLSSIATNNQPPFKALLTHGFVTDSQGRKMSKSLGNYVDPSEYSAKSGSEIIRLWACYGDYGHDISCGVEELTRVTETYRRIRNTMRFLLGSLFDFDPQKNLIEYQQLTELDQWALDKLFILIEEVKTAYESYEFYKVYHALNHFFTVTLSATYLDILKDRLYTWKVNGVQRRGSQTVLFYITDSLTKMMAPILSFLSEEVLEHSPWNKKESVFLLNFPEVNGVWKNETLRKKFDVLIKIRTEVQRCLETLRSQKTIGSSLEAKVLIRAEKEEYEILNHFSGLREFMIVSKIEVEKGAFAVLAEKASGEKCQRCWIYSEEISKEPDYFGICPKCVEALK